MAINESNIPKILPFRPILFPIIFPGDSGSFNTQHDQELEERLKKSPYIIIINLRSPDRGFKRENLAPVGILSRVVEIRKEEALLTFDLEYQKRIKYQFDKFDKNNKDLFAVWKTPQEKHPSKKEFESPEFQQGLQHIIVVTSIIFPQMGGEALIRKLKLPLDEKNVGSFIDNIASSFNLLEGPDVLLGTLVDISNELNVKKRMDFLKKLVDGVALGIFKEKIEGAGQERECFGEGIENQLSDGARNTHHTYRQRYEKIKEKMSPEARKETERELARLGNGKILSVEASMIQNHLDFLLDMPWGTYTEEVKDLQVAQRVLNEDHSGLQKVKDRILEFIAVNQFRDKGGTNILCFVGPPGVGKTSLMESIARALGKKFIRISLGGMRDQTLITGHAGTYVNAMPGKIISQIRNAGSANPVIGLDELDKIGTDFRGDPADALLAVLDPKQNDKFFDDYLNVPFDLSRVFFICAANTTDTVPGTLKDRLEIIELPGYTNLEKLAIAKDHLVQKKREENGFPVKLADSVEIDICFTENVIMKLIEEYTQEAGVRQLEREIAGIFRKAAKKIGLKELENTEQIENKKIITINQADLEEYAGKPKLLKEQRFEKMPPGCVPMFAVSDYGGHFFYIETAIEKNKDHRKIKVTGVRGSQKSDVNNLIEESIDVALDSLILDGGILSRTPEQKEKEGEFYIHVRVGDGAKPKDGPSAGIPMQWAIYGMLTDQSIRPNIGATGEIDLKLGTIGPVGGIRDKILAAHRAGIKIFIIPKENERELEDVPEEVKKELEIKPLSSVWEALHEAFPEDQKIIEYINKLNE